MLALRVRSFLLLNFRSIYSTPTELNIKEADMVPDDYTVIGGDDVGSGTHRLIGIRRALESYLSEVRAHSRMVAVERAEFELGKRHLANIMGIDPNHIAQEDIDKCVPVILFYFFLLTVLHFWFAALTSKGYFT